MLPDVRVHKSDISDNEGGGGKDKKVFIIGALENKPEPMTYMDGIDTISMVVSIVGRTCFDVAGPFGSYYVSWSMVMIFP